MMQINKRWVKNPKTGWKPKLLTSNENDKEMIESNTWLSVILALKLAEIIEIHCNTSHR